MVIVLRMQNYSIFLFLGLVAATTIRPEGPPPYFDQAAVSSFEVIESLCKTESCQSGFDLARENEVNDVTDCLRLSSSEDEIEGCRRFVVAAQDVAELDWIARH